MPDFTKYIKAMKKIYSGEKFTPRKKRAKETKPRKRTEGELSKRIEKDCDLLTLTGHIIHHDRLNCGMAMRGGYWIRLCKEGTSDRIIFCLNKLVIFIETKGKGKQSEDQELFMYKMAECGHLYFIVKTWDIWVEIKNKYIYTSFK